MKCSQRGCKMYLCDACNKWHFPGACEKDKFKFPRGYRFCPGCKRPVEKSEACNHISCRCGKHFCYYCGWGPCDDSSPVYSHLSECHSGCFNNPPDYRKYCLHENVSDDELNNFYKQYPQFKID